MAKTRDRGRGSGPVLGVDIGGTNIKWVHYADETVTDHGWLPTPQDGPDAVAAAIAKLASPQAVTALEVAVPGHLSQDHRSTRLIPNLPGHWDRYPMADRLCSATGISAVLLNDARAFARAELALGPGEGPGVAHTRPDTVFVTMGTGIGGAVAIHGQVLRGPGDGLGEIGHMTAVADGARCSCGARGCLETVAGGRALAAAWSRAQPPGVDPVGASHLVTAAEAGDTGALRILDEAGAALGAALGSALALLGLRTVVVGGGVAPAFAFMRAAAARVLESRHRLVGPVELLCAELGTQAGAIGAALEAATPPEPLSPAGPARRAKTPLPLAP